MFTKIQNGDTETKFQIGSESLTEKEWNQMLEKFDSQEDAIKEAVAEEIEKRKHLRSGLMLTIPFIPSKKVRTTRSRSMIRRPVFPIHLMNATYQSRRMPEPESSF
jgi:hypothetical protein